jgi:hypothetical protein
MLGKTLPIECHLDNMSLFDVVTRASNTLEMWVQLDVEAVRQSYARKEFTHIVLLRNGHNCAEAQTKVKTLGTMGKVLIIVVKPSKLRLVCYLAVKWIGRLTLPSILGGCYNTPSTLGCVRCDGFLTQVL